MRSSIWFIPFLFLAIACDPGVNIVEEPADQGDSSDASNDMRRDMTQDMDNTEEMSTRDMVSDVPTDKVDMGSDLGADMAEDMIEDMPIDMPPNPSEHPTRYLSDQLISPFAPSVVKSLRAIRAKGSGLKDNVFMKVGASGTVSTRLLHCYSPASSFQRNLHTYTNLQPSIDYFLQGDADGSDPFVRTTFAARSGRTASWVQSGSPSPLEQEISAISPRFAFVNYGTNDMQMGATYRSAMFPFYNNMTTLLDDLIAQGIIPIISGLNPRTDKVAASQWVPTYNALTRAMAEKRQIPYIDLYLASKDLPDAGLLSDGIHGNVYRDGGVQPCIFTDEAMAFNYNVRNLLSMQTLHRAKQTTVDQQAGTDSPTPWRGDGTQANPYEINALPFSHAADTSASNQSLIDAYPSCDTGQNESGPEVYYTLTLSKETPVRLMVFDLAGVDVDIHLLDATGDPMGCLDRNDKTIERTLPAGTYTIVVDTFVSRSNKVNSGDYTFIAVECDSGDASCK